MSKKIISGENSVIEGEKVKFGENVKIGKNTIIRGKNIFIGNDVIIGDNTNICVNNIYIGFHSKIEKNCKIISSGGNGELFIGDNSMIGHDSNIVLPVLKIGDYVKLNNHLLANGYNPCIIGSNVWIGQNCILNATEMLTIGNGVGIGAYNSIWTHGSHGELLDGCNLFKKAPVIIEEDAWLLGSYNVVYPGVTIGKRSVIFTGSIITKNVSPNSCVGGNPAKDINMKTPMYKELTIAEKYKMMKEFMNEFVDTYYKKYSDKLENGWRIKRGNQIYEIIFLQKTDDKSIKGDYSKIIFTKKNIATKNSNKLTIFDIAAKRYTKRRTEVEIEIMNFLLYSKARFYPYKKL